MCYEFLKAKNTKYISYSVIISIEIDMLNINIFCFFIIFTDLVC